MTATIPSPQLEAIIRLELAAIALDKARRTIEHPDLAFGGGAIVAPSGLKHLEEIRHTLRVIDRALRPHDPATGDASAAPPKTGRVVDDLSGVATQMFSNVTLNIAGGVQRALRGAHQQLALLPELQSDQERLEQVLMAAFEKGSELGHRLYAVLGDDDHPAPTSGPALPYWATSS